MKHLPKLRDCEGTTRKRYLYVAIGRAFRYVHLAVMDDETTALAAAFLTDALDAFPFRVTHVLTDRGSCFTADAFEAACERHGVQHRKTRPYTPKTTDVIDKSFLRGSALFLAGARATAWRRAGREVGALRRSLYRRTSVAAPVRTFFGPCGFQPVTKRA